jgi:hypothetical protein
MQLDPEPASSSYFGGAGHSYSIVAGGFGVTS